MHKMKDQGETRLEVSGAKYTGRWRIILDE